MKKVILLGLGVLLNLSLVHASGKFEGSFTIHSEPAKSANSHEKPEDISVSIKGTKIALVPPARDKMNKVRMIVDMTASTTTILMENNGKKHGMVRPANEASLRANSHDNSKVTETKEKKVIDGYQCHKVIIESDKFKSEAWITNDAGISMEDLSMVLTATRGPMGDPSGLGGKSIMGCPIEVTTTDKTKKTESTMHIKDIKKGPVDASVFSTDGYEMSQMPGAGPGGPGKPGMPQRPGQGQVPPAPNGGPMDPQGGPGRMTPPSTTPDGRPIPPPAPAGGAPGPQKQAH